MSDAQSNDPVFPRETKYSGEWGTIQLEGALGLTKRELFAAMAMQGLCTGSSPLADCAETSKAIARMAVADADALLAALDRLEDVGVPMDKRTDQP